MEWSTRSAQGARCTLGTHATPLGGRDTHGLCTAPGARANPKAHDALWVCMRWALHVHGVLWACVLPPRHVCCTLGVRTLHPTACTSRCLLFSCVYQGSLAHARYTLQSTLRGFVHLSALPIGMCFLDMGCTRLKGVYSSVHTQWRPLACSLVHTPSYASGLCTWEVRSYWGWAHASRHGMHSSRERVLLDACFAALKGVLFDRRSESSF